MCASPTDTQNTANQRQELEAWAERSGHTVMKVYEDQGISGAKGRDQRPEFDALLKAASRREFSMIAVWSSDRLGRRRPTLGVVAVPNGRHPQTFAGTEVAMMLAPTCQSLTSAPQQRWRQAPVLDHLIWRGQMAGRRAAWGL